MSHIIDAKGKPCPQPVLLAKQAIGAGESAFVVEVDNTTAVGNLQRLAASQGFSAEVEERADGVFALSFEQTGEAPACGEAVGAAQPKTYSVFVGRDIIGDGDRELGTNLMRMFFYTLLQSGDLPQSVCFMNAGAKLPACDEQVAEHLKGLVEKGVEVLVCGTCLNFYGVSDRLQVGTVSNMYDILTRMQQAGKVISL